MKPRFTHSIIPALLLAAPISYGQWLTVSNPDDYELGGEEQMMAYGWVFQDGDYIGFPNCVDGTNDCTGYRAIVPSPFDPQFGSSKSVMMKAGDPEQTQVANSVHNTAIALPEPIPVNSDATLFFQFSIDEEPGVRFFGLSDKVFENIGPIADPDNMPLGWGDLGPIFAVNEVKQFRVYEPLGGGYVNAFEDPNDPDANLAEAGVWYSVWMHINNDAKASDADIGGHMDLYIAGGKFGNTPVHITNTTQIARDNDLTAWTFRRNEGNPLITFDIIGQYGNPNSSTLGFGATYINGIYLAQGVHTLEAPWGASSDGETWADWSDDTVDNWIDTEDFLGWIYFDDTGWIYTQDHAAWYYLPENNVQQDGAWTYIPRL